jgi:predicted phosphoribosyltransferase
MITKFADRRQAGRVLGFLLSGYRKMSNGMVLAVSRGGVPVAYEVARALSLPLDALDASEPRGLNGVIRKATGRCVILVDDGLPSAAPLAAIVSALREASPAQIVVAVPVASPESVEELSGLVAETICATAPRPFRELREWYRRSEDVTDDGASQLLRMAIAMSPPYPTPDLQAHG